MTTAAVGGDVNFENENGAKEEVVVTEGQVSAPFIDSSYPLLQGDNTCSDFSEVSVAKEEGPVSFRFVEEKKEEEEFADCVQERGASKSIGSSSGTNGPVKHSDPSLKSTEQFLKTAVFQSRQRQTEAKGESIAESFPAVSREVVTPKLTERETDKNKEASNHQKKNPLAIATRMVKSLVYHWNPPLQSILNPTIAASSVKLRLSIRNALPINECPCPLPKWRFKIIMMAAQETRIVTDVLRPEKLSALASIPRDRPRMLKLRPMYCPRMLARQPIPGIF